jgi:CRISPR-associated endonuclease Cas1
LLVEDGIADERWTARFSRLDRQLKRVVIIGHAGTITLDAIRWLHGVGVPLVHLDTDGTVFLVAAPSGAIVPALRRAQAMAAETGLGVRLSQELIVGKVEGQHRLLDRLPGSKEAQQTIQKLLGAIRQTTRLQDLRRLEGMAGRAYWRGWQGLPVKFKPADARRCPWHWQVYGTRVSALTASQSPRKAVNPANAVLNYLYAILEAEARIAALAVGLDPALGLMHADQRNRDSLASDLMEPVRPAVDAYLLDLLSRHTFRKADVHELLTGQCRLLPPLTEDLAATAPLWARKVVPIAQRVAASLLAAEQELVNRSRARERLSSTGGSAAAAGRGRGVVMRGYRPRVEPDRDSRRAPAAGSKRRQAMAQVVAANRAWSGGAPDPATFRGTVAPKLKQVKLDVLVGATGLTKSACSRIRAGMVLPHPRHWKALAALVSERLMTN